LAEFVLDFPAAFPPEDACLTFAARVLLEVLVELLAGELLVGLLVATSACARAATGSARHNINASKQKMLGQQ